MSEYVAPQWNEDSFNCPFCTAFAHQLWSHIHTSFNNAFYTPNSPNGVFQVSKCDRCGRWAMWHDEVMILPNIGGAPNPNSDLSEELKHDYEEARSIVNHSPRGAAALLRLLVQKLIKELGESGTNINSDIKSLVKKGLPVPVQKALDTVRVIGNEAVHPGQIDLNDNPAMAQSLFKVINLIANRMISEQKEMDELYEGLPKEKRDSIDKRDS